MRRPSLFQINVLLLAGLVALQLALAAVIAVASFTVNEGAEEGLRFALFLLASALWSFATVVGLVRRRRWGLILILIHSVYLSTLAAYAFLTDISTLVRDIRLSGVHVEFTPTPSFLGHIVFYLCLFALGVWWLIYFRRPATRALFPAA